jgi:hypothetical protein
VEKYKGNFERDFDYNWSLKNSTILKLAGKTSVPILQKAVKILSWNLGHSSFSRQKFPHNCI